MRFLGIKIHGGYTSEAHVFSSLLAHRETSYDAAVLYHTVSDITDTASAFEHDARVTVTRIDAGLRVGLTDPLLPVKKLASIVHFRAALPRLLELARNVQPDVIYSSQQPWDCAAASYLARRLHKPQIIHLHYSIGPWLRTGFSSNPRAFAALSTALGLANPLDRLLACDHVVAISDYIRDEAIHHGVVPECVTTIHNTITPSPLAHGQRAGIRTELGVPTDAPVIGIVGRLDPDKGHEDTLKAFISIASTYPDAYLIIVGDGPRFVMIQEEARRAGLGERVLLTGWRPDVPRLLAAIDIFAHPSRREPFGLAVIEAMAHGLPVVAYAEGAMLEIVVQGETGLLAPPGNIAAMAGYFAKLIDDRGLARGMGARGRKNIATNFKPEDAAHAFFKVLQHVAC